jgi:potassium-transporting ATPase KdpC subunit
MNMNEKIITKKIVNNLQIVIRIVIVMAILLGIAYPVLLVGIGQLTLPFQSNGSVLELDGKKVGSELISQNFTSLQLFHPRAPGDSASGVDPHITPENAYAQIKNISKSTGIKENALKTILNLNIERNKITNGLFFAPDYVNVLQVNLDLINQYPEVYNKTLGSGINE